MLWLILIVGGRLIMMGQHDRSEALFYYFRLEDHVPETHLLRLIEKHISFAFVREKLKASYSDTGRPSIDPELLLRILLIGYLYGITSERKLVEELRMHLAWRWFTGLGFDQEIPHHSTFSKNRHGRFQESKLFEELFEQIVKQCVEVGLVQGKHLSVDGSFVEANACIGGVGRIGIGGRNLVLFMHRLQIRLKIVVFAPMPIARRREFGGGMRTLIQDLRYMACACCSNPQASPLWPSSRGQPRHTT